MRGPGGLLRKALSETGGGTVFASLFGSYRRGDYDAHSDIDILIVHEDGDEKGRIARELRRLESMLGRPVHLNLFSFKEFQRRVRLGDYLIRSILEDSSFLVGRRDVFLEARRALLGGRLDDDAARFNAEAGLRLLNDAYLYFNEAGSSLRSHRGNMLDYTIRGLNSYRLALGYLCSSWMISSKQRSASHDHLMRTPLARSLGELALIEAKMKRASGINCSMLLRIADEMKNRSLRLLSLSRGLRWQIFSSSRIGIQEASSYLDAYLLPYFSAQGLCR